ncbi:MAG TPA: APC family permease [Acidothermaceae bacterium]
MSIASGVVKRMLVGRALRSDRLGETLLPKKLALPVFATDAVSSVGYATQEILLVLAAGGALYYHWTWLAAGAVCLILLTVVMSYRQNVRAYPSGGGDYEVATTNLGRNAGITVASALLVDYVMTVAVSISSGVDTFLSTPALAHLRPHKVEIVLGCLLFMVLVNLRGVRESGKVFALPVYGFMVGIYGMALYALVRVVFFDDTLLAPTAHATVVPTAAAPAGFALVFLVLRAFASGCTALTGIEAISNGVPAFKEPKPKNAAATLLIMGTIAVGMFASITVLSLYTKVRVTDSDANLLIDGKPPVHGQETAVAQVAQAVFSNFSPAIYFVTATTLIILVLAANTAFNGFPVLGSILARDGYLPRQLHTRGDRLAFSNGIVLLGAFAAALIIGFDANVTRLIQLYIVGVFVSFTLSQLGMIRHWNRHLRTESDAAARGRMQRSRVISFVGFSATATVLVVVILTKFTHGAWLAILAMIVFFLVMKGIRRHYDAVKTELFTDVEAETALPARVFAIVLLSKLHKPALRAISYARATRPSVLEAVTVNVDPEETAALERDWERHDLPVPLKVLDSPYREVTPVIVDYIRRIRRTSPRDVVTVFIPEYVVGHWWEHLLHNQAALRLKGRLLFMPGVMVVSVPWQLRSSEAVAERLDEDAAAGAAEQAARRHAAAETKAKATRE